MRRLIFIFALVALPLFGSHTTASAEDLIPDQSATSLVKRVGELEVRPCASSAGAPGMFIVIHSSGEPQPNDERRTAVVSITSIDQATVYSSQRVVMSDKDVTEVGPYDFDQFTNKDIKIRVATKLTYGESDQSKESMTSPETLCSSQAAQNAQSVDSNKVSSTSDKNGDDSGSWLVKAGYLALFVVVVGFAYFFVRKN